MYEATPKAYAYKCIDAIVQDLVDQGFVTVIASFRPLLSLKTNSSAGELIGHLGCARRDKVGKQHQARIITQAQPATTRVRLLECRALR
jgi:hypothetical protein